MKGKSSGSHFKLFKPALISALIFLCGCSPTPSTTDSPSLEFQTTSITPFGQAPNFRLHDLNGEVVSLGAYKGKIVLLNFWATWCAPCKDEIQKLRKLQNSLVGLPFAVLTIGLDAEPARFKRFAEENKLPFPVLLDPDDRARHLYEIGGLPVTLIISKQGEILSFPDPQSGELNSRFVGPRNWDAPNLVSLFRALSVG